MSSELSQPSSYWSGYDVLWGLHAPSRRTTLDRLQIVDGAIGIADQEGLGAVTMRNVARAVHTSPMSLYRHVPDKEALVSMMVDRAIETAAARGDRPSSGGWRAGLEFVATTIWQLCRRHPWFAEATMARPPVTPSGIAGFEYALSCFDDLPVDIATAAQFVNSVFATVVASAFSLAMNEAARLRARVSNQELFAEAAPVFARIMEDGSYPRVTAFILSAEPRDDSSQMRASVDLILDGIAAPLKPAPGLRSH